VIVIDIDHFGRFNHSDGGQDSGDMTLRLAAGAFAEAIREDDIVYRRGGEEFVVLLPDATLDEARQVAVRIAATLHRHGLPHPDQERVTASIGVAAFDPAAQVSSADVITAADTAMRRAKDEGRDRIVIAGV
jgi:diguanylate cyclase (GGDEF)-like protein